MRRCWLLAVLALGGCVTAGALDKASIRNQKRAEEKAQIGDAAAAQALHERAVADQLNARLIDHRRTSWLRADTTLQ